MKPNPQNCEGCPSWDDINGCWKDIIDIWDCVFINEEDCMFDGDLYDEIRWDR